MLTQDHPDHIAKTRLAIRGMLALLRKRVRPENLAQLIYLADSKYYESVGMSITGIQYIRGKHGPVAEDDAIIKQVVCLVKDGLICKAPDPFKRDALSYRYWVEDPKNVWQEVRVALGMGDEDMLRDIVRQYGSISSASDLAAISKCAAAYKNARPGERIQFKQSERAIELQNMLDSNPEFLAEVERGFADLEAGRWVSDEELMAKLTDG